MKTKFLRIAAILTLCLFILTGCISDEEQQRGEEMIAAAREMIPDYLNEKYGFSAEIVDISGEISLSGVWSEHAYYNGIVIATCEYDDKVFQIRVNLKDETFGDDYQREEIGRDFALFAKNNFSLASHVVPQNVWLYGFWSKDDYYDGNMDDFIGSVSVDNTRTQITLLFGIVADNKDDVLQQLSDEAETLRQLMQNKANITLAFYDADEFSYDEIKNKIQNYDEFSLRLVSELNIVDNREESSQDGETPELFVKSYDYTHYSLVPEDEGWDGIEVCGYSVNGETFSKADRIYFNSSTYHKDYWESDATVLTSYFDYGSSGKDSG